MTYSGSLIKGVLFSLAVGGVSGCSSQGAQSGTEKAIAGSMAEHKTVSAPVSEVVEADADKVYVQYDEFTKDTYYTGALYSVDSVVDWKSRSTRIKLVAQQASAETFYSLHIYVMYEAKRYAGYSSITDISGTRWPIYDSEHDVDCSDGLGCMLTEEMLVAIDRKEIENRRDSGFRLRLEGARGSQELDLPAKYINSFLAKVPDRN